MGIATSGQVVRPRNASGRSWQYDAAVMAAAQESMKARRAWMKMAPPENWLLRDLAPVQIAALRQMLVTDADYRAAKAAALAQMAQITLSTPLTQQSHKPYVSDSVGPEDGR